MFWQTKKLQTDLELRSIDLIDAHGRGGERCTSLSKYFEKLDHKIAIKHKNRGPLSIFSHNPKYPLQKNFKMTVTDLLVAQKCFHSCWFYDFVLLCQYPTRTFLSKQLAVHSKDKKET